MPESSQIKIFIVDDQAMLRAAFRSLIVQHSIAQVVGECGDARASIALIAKVRPDVVLLDITMPGLSGIDALPTIKKSCPETRVLMMTQHEGETFVQQALSLGADGYLTKDSDPDELALAIRSVMQGRAYVSPKVTHGLMAAGGVEPARGRDGPGSIQSLTPREREVFLLLAIGKSTKEVARTLGLGIATAKKHRENLQRKLGCHSTAELARLAIREGLLGT